MEHFSKFPTSWISKLNGAYTIEHTASGKFYVGSTNDLAGRRSRHLTDLKYNRHPNLHLQRAYNLDPRIEFFFVITEDREQAYDYEQTLLDIHMEQGNLFNMAKDARIAVIELSEESKEKHRAALTGLKRSEETKDRMRQAKLGKSRSEEVREALRKHHLGTKLSEETRRKMSESRKGMKMPPRTLEHLEKIKQAKLNFKHDPETIARIRSSMPTSKEVSIDGKVYPSVSEAARQIGLSHRAIRGRITDGKYPLWFYIE